MPRGRSRKARDASRARTMSLVRTWAVTLTAAVVLVLGVIELVTSGKLSSMTSGMRGPRDLSSIVVDLDRAIDGTLVKMGATGVTVETTEHEDEHYTWTHKIKNGSVPRGASLFESNLAITEAVRKVGGRVIRAGEGLPDWRGLKTIEMRLGYGNIETHVLTLRESESEDRVARALEEGASPRIAIVIDDFGYSCTGLCKEFIEMDAPLTISVLPNCAHTAEAAEAAHRAGKEVMVHVPMQPLGYPDVNPGEGVLLIDHTREQLTNRIDAALAEVPHAAGANNHMGSAFTAYRIQMRVVMGRLKERGLYFLDSMTTPASVGLAEAERAGIPTTRNRMFIDSPLDESGRVDVASQLEELVAIARKRGEAVGIGHPHPETLRVLKDVLPELREQGIELVFVSQLVH